MAMSYYDMNTVILVPDWLIMSQAVDMPIFQLIDWKLENKTFGQDRKYENKTLDKDIRQGISMVVVMKRKITSEMMTTYFPSLLLTAITFATTFFKPFFFEAALSVNLTTMLVMTTIFISKMEGLPPTSDIKMIDIWLVLCQMVPFAEVVLLTAMEYNREDKKKVKRTKKKGKKKSRNMQTTSLAVAPMDENHRDDDRNLSVVMNADGNRDVEQEGKWYQWSWIPQLKTLGI